MPFDRCSHSNTLDPYGTIVVTAARRSHVIVVIANHLLLWEKRRIQLVCYMSDCITSKPKRDVVHLLFIHVQHACILTITFMLSCMAMLQ